MEEGIPPFKNSKALASAGRKVVIVTTVIVILVCTYGSYFLIRDGAPWWPLLILWAMGAFFGILAARTFMPGADEKLAAALAESGRSRAASARIVELRRLGSVETSTMRQTRVRLTVMLPEDEEQERPVTINDVYIEDALLSGFATGNSVHVLYDPAAPERVAIDRERSPVAVQ